MTDNTEALQYADLIDRQHDGVVAATIIRELVAENEALKNALRMEETISFRRQMQTYAALNEDLVEALRACIDYGAMTGDEWVSEKARAALAKAGAGN